MESNIQQNTIAIRHTNDVSPKMLSYEALSRLTDKLLLATKTAGIGVWEYCLERKVFIADKVSLALYGVADREGDPDFNSWLERVHTDDRARLQQEFYQALSAHAECTSEFRVVWPDGSVHVIKSVVVVERDIAGNALRLIGVNKDVTIYKEAERAIRESEAKYRSFFENSMDGLLLTETDGPILAANPAACNIFQMTEAEIRKAGRFGIVDVNDPQVGIRLQERQRSGRTKGDITYKRKNGTTFPGELTAASFTDAGGNNRTSMIVRDITERRRAEQQLIATSSALQLAVNDLNRIMDASPDIICTINKEGRLVNVSSASAIILGFHPVELIGRKYLDFVWHEDVEHTKQVAAAVIKGTPVTMFENRHVCKDGSIVPLLWSARWVEADQVMYCTAKDAREKKRLEQAFESERARFYDLFLHAPCSLCILKGPDHVFEMANDLYLQLAGRKNLIGKTMREAFPEIGEQGFVEALDSVYITGESFIAKEQLVQIYDEETGEQKDIYLNFVCQAYRNKDNEIEGVFVFAVDLTEQVLAQEKITKKSANLQTILTNTDIGYVLLSRKMKVIAFNPVANNWIINAHAQPLQEDSNYLNYISAGQVEMVKENIEKVLGGQSLEYEVQKPDLDGTCKWYFVKMNPILADKNDVYGICIAVEDITQTKEAEIEKEKMTFDLLQRNKDLEQFNYIVSHNVRSHVANIAGICGLLNDESCSADADTHDTFWQQLCASVENLDVVLKDLNSILQIRKEIKEFNEEVQFSKLVRVIKESIACQIHSTGAVISTNFSEVEAIIGVKSYLYSIFYNLITNSIKYRKPGERPLISITSKAENGSVKLIFKDNGLGINMERKGDQLFKLYKRFHEHVEGKGMGLFMTKTQVESLGGTINIESKVNEGTVITIIL
jgi:PAS domain S-box-containing protein